jgi:hypothetical protein
MTIRPIEATTEEQQASNLPIIPPPPIQTNTQTQKETPLENLKQATLVLQPHPIPKLQLSLISKPQNPQTVDTQIANHSHQ